MDAHPEFIETKRSTHYLWGITVDGRLYRSCDDGASWALFRRCDVKHVDGHWVAL